MENKLILPLILQFAGVLVIIAEIIIPSGGILAVVAGGLITWSLYAVFTGVSVNAGMILVCVDIVLLPILVIVGLKLLAKSPATLRTELSSSQGVTVQDSQWTAFVGMEGVALTDLRPSGAASIDGRRVDVVSRGDYIPKGTQIVVHSVTGNQMIVDVKKYDT